MKKTETLLTQFWVISYITSEFNFFENFLVFKKTKPLLTQFWVIMYITSEFSFDEQSTNFIDSILDNN